MSPAARKTHALAQPRLTGGEGRDELTPCEYDVAVRRAIRDEEGVYPPSPFDVLTDRAVGPKYRAAVEEAKAMCGRCPIRDACHEAQRDEDWVKAVRDIPLRRSTVSPERRARQEARDKLRRDALDTLVANGGTLLEAQAWLGMSDKGIYGWCRRNDALDIYRALTASEGRKPNQHTKEQAA